MNTNKTEEKPDTVADSGRVQRLVSFNFYDGGFWVRLFGVGISVVNKERHLPLFSERNGHRKILRLGKWGFEFISERQRLGAAKPLPTPTCSQ